MAIVIRDLVMAEINDACRRVEVVRRLMSIIVKVFQSKLFWGIVLVGLAVLTWRPRKELPPQIPVGKQGMTLLGSNLIGWKKQEPKWEVKAETIWRSKDEKTIIFQNLSEAVIYKTTTDNGRSEHLSFSAPWAELNMRTNILRLGGGIKGRINQGGFETEEAQVNTETNEIEAPGKIIFFHDDLRIEAQQMTGNLDTEALVFTGEVLLEEGDYTARGKSLKYYGKEERYVLEEEIEVELEL